MFYTGVNCDAGEVSEILSKSNKQSLICDAVVRGTRSMSPAARCDVVCGTRGSDRRSGDKVVDDNWT